MEIPINERIKEIVKGSGKSITAYAKEIGVSQPTLKACVDGTNSPSFDTLNKILIGNPIISSEWLITGKGSMLKDGENKDPLAASPESSINYRFVPLLNLDAVGGMHRLNNEDGDTEHSQDLIPFADAREGDFCLHVTGDSMAPTCPSGSLILVREVERWKEYFGFGNLFVILLADGRRILKEVQKYTPNSKEYVLCKSHNEKYPEEELPKSLIKGVFKVIKIQSDRGW